LAACAVALSDDIIVLTPCCARAQAGPQEILALGARAHGPKLRTVTASRRPAGFLPPELGRKSPWFPAFVGLQPAVY